MTDDNKPTRILIADDDRGVLTSLSLLLRQSGFLVETAASADDALATVMREDLSLVIQDMNFSRSTTGDEGLELLQRIKGRCPHLPVVLITAWGSVELAVKGMKAGASDFITKPWTHEQIHHVVATSLGLAATRIQDGAPEPTRGELDRSYDFSRLVGEDPRFLRILHVIGRVAATEAPVLITGESGTGKELVADALWRNSGRRGGPFVKVNLGGIPSTLFESEMFGHVRGAFTGAVEARTGRFEAAHHGTLFLDEVGDLDGSCQVKLLRALQDRCFERVGSSSSVSVDVRVISATNRDLPALIEEGRFREDLLYRLNLIALHIPPLRERVADIPLLANHILHEVGESYGRPEVTLAPDGLDWLAAQRWPGNVRQLQHHLERTLLLSSGPRIGAGELRTVVESAAHDSLEASVAGGQGTLRDMEREHILRTIQVHNGNLTRVAEALGISRGALYRRLERHGIEP